MPIAPGMAAGGAYVYRDIDLAALETKKFVIENIGAEIERFDVAISKSKEQLRDLRAGREESSWGEVEEIFDVQLSLLEDAEFLDEIRELLDAQRLNLEHLIALKIRQVNLEFSKIADTILRARISDIHDTYHRILRNLLEIDHVRTRTLQRITTPVMLVSERLLPSDLAQIDVTCLLGVALDEVSALSHVAIMLRSLGIPAVGNAPGLAATIRSGDPLLIDAEKGLLVINPQPADIAVLDAFRERQRLSLTSEPQSGGHATADGVPILLAANAGSLAEVAEAMRLRADGIGLLRSEMFYMSKTALPTVEEEERFYRDILALLAGQPLVVRLLDISAEKRVPYLLMRREENPQLGVRGLRYLFEHRDLLERQCAALAALAGGEKPGVLIPFVTTPSEIGRVLAIIEEDLRRAGKKRSDLQVGIMVEIPAAALDITPFLRGIDFVSIGTNDLVQYLFAASREERMLDRYRCPVHPVVLRLVGSIVAACEKAGKGLTVCGDMSSDPFSALLLVGLGVRSLSLQPHAISAVDTLLRSVSLDVLKGIAAKALEAGTVEEVMALQKELRG
jgi:phosphotransferase system enzyme I (PtsI)